MTQLGGWDGLMKLRESVLGLTHNVGISTGFGFNWATQTLESHRESRETGSTLVWPCVETVLPKGVGTRDVASAPVTPRPPNGECTDPDPTLQAARRPTDDGSTASKSSRIQTYRGSQTWDAPSAGPSLNRTAAACGLPATLRTAQAFTSPCPPEWSSR